jgi:hypothetical protein
MIHPYLLPHNLLVRPPTMTFHYYEITCLKITLKWSQAVLFVDLSETKFSSMD